MYIFFVGIFESKFWIKASTNFADNRTLSTLFGGVQEGVLQSKADSTTKIYTSWFSKFELFCERHRLSHLPASPMTVAIFLQFFRKTLSHSSIIQAQAAISWAHGIAMESDPTLDPLVQNLIQSNKRQQQRGPVHKEPATIQHLEELADFSEKNPSDKNLRTLVLAILAFAGCMRISDFIGLSRKNFRFLENSHVEICLTRTKTDQFREGNLKCIPAARNPRLCPLILLKKWFSSGTVGISPNSPAFPMLTNPGKPVSMSSFRDGLKEALESSDLPTITPHSFRAGFATQAINSGVDASDLKEFGLWKSDSSVQRYTRRSTAKKLQTGKLAGL